MPYQLRTKPIVIIGIILTIITFSGTAIYADKSTIEPAKRAILSATINYKDGSTAEVTNIKFTHKNSNFMPAQVTIISSLVFTKTTKDKGITFTKNLEIPLNAINIIKTHPAKHFDRILPEIVLYLEDGRKIPLANDNSGILGFTDKIELTPGFAPSSLHGQKHGTTFEYTSGFSIEGDVTVKGKQGRLDLSVFGITFRDNGIEAITFNYK